VADPALAQISGLTSELHERDRADPMWQLDAGNRHGSVLEAFETEHRRGA